MALLSRLRACVGRPMSAWRRHRVERLNTLALRRLDARLLRDLGLDRSEAGSVACELSGSAERTRLRALGGIGGDRQ
jgi:uncharacterized protein YjiS (DUF1127 family)